MTAFRIDDLPIESQMLTSALDEAQRKVRRVGRRAGSLAGWRLGAQGLGASRCRWFARSQAHTHTSASCPRCSRPCPSRPFALTSRQVESYFYDIRKQLFEYDQVLNTQASR